MTPNDRNQMAVDILTVLADHNGDLTVRLERLCRKWGIVPHTICGSLLAIPTLQAAAQVLMTDEDG